MPPKRKAVDIDAEPSPAKRVTRRTTTAAALETPRTTRSRASKTAAATAVDEESVVRITRARPAPTGEASTSSAESHKENSKKRVRRAEEEATPRRRRVRTPSPDVDGDDLDDGPPAPLSVKRARRAAAAASPRKAPQRLPPSTDEGAAGDDTGNDASPSSTPTKRGRASATRSPRKKVAAALDDTEDDELAPIPSSPTSPSKRRSRPTTTPRASPRKKAAVLTLLEDTDDDDHLPLASNRARKPGPSLRQFPTPFSKARVPVSSDAEGNDTSEGGLQDVSPSASPAKRRLMATSSPRKRAIAENEEPTLVTDLPASPTKRRGRPVAADAATPRASTRKKAISPAPPTDSEADDHQPLATVKKARPSLRQFPTPFNKKPLPPSSDIGTSDDGGDQESPTATPTKRGRGRQGILRVQTQSPRKSQSPRKTATFASETENDDLPPTPSSPTKSYRAPLPSSPTKSRPFAFPSSPTKRSSTLFALPALPRTPSKRAGRADAPAPFPSPAKNRSPTRRPPSPAKAPRSPVKIPPALAPDVARLLAAQQRAILRAIHSCDGIDYAEPEPEEEAVEEEWEPHPNEVTLGELTALLQGTVVRGEGNSCFVLGPPGSGKSAIFEQSLARAGGKPVVIRLSGIAQTSDKLAMREIAYQLTQQTGTTYLSGGDEDDEDAEDMRPPDEDEEPRPAPTLPQDADENPFVVSAGIGLASPSHGNVSLPPAAQLPALISVLTTLDRPVVLLLDAIDLFALHPRQALLYCALDAAQSCQAQPGRNGLAVVGLTSRLDTLYLLEKRVKSRFSQRVMRTGPVRAAAHYAELARRFLIVEAGEGVSGEWRAMWMEAVGKFLGDAEVEGVLRDTFSLSRDVRVLGRILTAMMVRLTPQAPFPTAAALQAAVATQRVRPPFAYLPHLSYPALCLLVAWLHWDTVGHPEVNFEMLRKSFEDAYHASHAAPVTVNGVSIGMPKCSKAIMLGAFEALIDLRMFVPVAAPSASIGNTFVKYRCAIERYDIKDAVNVDGQVALKKWMGKTVV